MSARRRSGRSRRGLTHAVLITRDRSIGASWIQSTSATLSACESSAATGGCEVEPICPIKSPIGRLRGRLWALLEDTSLRDLKGPVPAAVGTDSTDPIKAAGL